MKKFNVTMFAAVVLGLAVTPPTAIAQDNAPGDPGGSGCVYCYTRYLPFQKTVDADCRVTNVNVGYGYRRCDVVVNWPSSSEHCEFSNYGVCNLSGGGSGGGYIP